MTAKSITGCILAKNEEKLIAGCIGSLSEFCTEIILVDNGSTDGTASIAKEKGCRVVSSPTTVIDEGRNVYLDYVTTPWVFVLDADERIHSQYARLILDTAQNAPQDFFQYKFNKYNYYGDGKFSIQNSTARFFRSSTDIRYNITPMHATIDASLRKCNGKTGFIDVSLQHYDAILAQRQIGKRRAYFDYLYKNLGELEPVQLFCLGVEFATLRKYDDAFHIFDKISDEHCGYERCLAVGAMAQLGLLTTDFSMIDYALGKLKDIENTTNREVLLSVAAARELAKGDKSRAVELCIEAVNVSDDVDALLNLVSLVDESNPKLALSCLKRAMSKNENLLNPTIYVGKGELSTYEFQSIFLDSYIDYAYHMARSYHALRMDCEAANWCAKREELYTSRDLETLNIDA